MNSINYLNASIPYSILYAAGALLVFSLEAPVLVWLSSKERFLKDVFTHPKSNMSRAIQAIKEDTDLEFWMTNKTENEKKSAIRDFMLTFGNTNNAKVASMVATGSIQPDSVKVINQDMTIERLFYDVRNRFKTVHAA